MSERTNISAQPLPQECEPNEREERPMESELPECGVCGTRGTHRVGAETAAPAVGCHCGVIVTGFTEGEAIERWETLARRAEIGALVERIVANENMLDVYRATLGGPPLFTTRGFGGNSANGPTLLDALRSLAKEVSGE